MPKITVSIIDKRIRDAYQNVIEGRPLFSETVLETKSLREAIERALAEMEKVQDYESVVVRDEKQASNAIVWCFDRGLCNANVVAPSFEVIPLL